MSKQESRCYSIDGDTVVVSRVYDAEIGQHINDYPDFNTHPRRTPTGKAWVNAYKEDCPYDTSEYGDCGSCEYFRTENEGDLIGVCEYNINCHNNIE